MKKYLLIIGIMIFLTSSSITQASLHSKKAQEINTKISKIYQDLGKENKECRWEKGNQLDFAFRLENLKDSTFFEFISDILPLRNACAMNDLKTLEDSLNIIFKKGPISEISCGNNLTVLEKTKAVMAEVSCLRKYGDKDPATIDSDKKCANYGYGHNLLALEYAGQYTDARCKDNTWSKIWSKTAEDWNSLIKTLKNLQKKSTWMSGYDPETIAIENASIPSKAQQNAKDWINNNLKIEGKMFSAGLRFKLLKKAGDNQDKGKKDLKDKYQPAPPKLPDFYQQDRSASFSKVESQQDSYDFSKKLSETFVNMKIRQSMDQELVENSMGIEADLNSLICDLRITYESEANKNLACTEQDTNLDGLNQKTATLKKMIDNHCK